MPLYQKHGGPIKRSVAMANFYAAWIVLLAQAEDPFFHEYELVATFKKRFYRDRVPKGEGAKSICWTIHVGQSEEDKRAKL